MFKSPYQKFLTENRLITDNSRIINFKNFEEHINSNTAKKMVYLGIDPTKGDLHLGHLVQLMMLKKLEKYFQVAIVLGTSTARIGDPSGKKAERKIISVERVRINTTKIKRFLRELNLYKNCVILDNDKWINKIKLVDFLCYYGKCINITNLLNKVTIKTRLKIGISVAEFLYSIVQGIDFLYLYNEYDCVGQIGGSDQKGNIVNGIELINTIAHHKKQEKRLLFGITTALLTDSEGNKIGKSESNNIPIFKHHSATGKLFNFLYNTADRDVEKRFQLFTDCDYDKIQYLHELNITHPKSDKFLQTELCKQVFCFLSAEKAFNLHMFFAKTIYKKDFNELQAGDLKIIKQAFDNQQSWQDSSAGVCLRIIQKQDLENQNFICFLKKYQICDSKTKARQLVISGAITINNVKIVKDVVNITVRKIFKNHNIKTKENIFMIKLGKRRRFLLKLIE